MTDNWILTRDDRIKYDKQFNVFQPIDGYLAGDKARAVLVKSGLPMPVLGKIWGLADMDGDGKLTSFEYSIAVHLVRKVLLGMELPSVLPSILLIDPLLAPKIVEDDPDIAAAKIAAANKLAAAKAAAERAEAEKAAAEREAEAILEEARAKAKAKRAEAERLAARAAMDRAAAEKAVADKLAADKLAMEKAEREEAERELAARKAAENMAVQQLYERKTMTPSVSFGSTPCSSQASPLASPTHGDNWVIKAHHIYKYQKVFEMVDRLKKGYLTGLETKAVLSKSGLPNSTLATIWGLADIDGDGKLVPDEFYVAMYLTNLAKNGHHLPATLPPEYIPPAYRISSDIFDADDPNIFDVKVPVHKTSAVQSPETEEEKRLKAELEKERLELEKRLEEERLRQEEERIKMEEERAKLEEERKKVEEEEKQKQLEEQRKKEKEEKDKQLLDAAMQRQMEWEHQRRDQLILLKAREQNLILQIEKDIQKFNNNATNSEKKRTETETKLLKTQSVLSEFTSAIEAMRDTRDAKLVETEALKVQIEEGHKKLMLAQQEKSLLNTKLEAIHKQIEQTHNEVLGGLNKSKKMIEKLNVAIKKIDLDLDGRSDTISFNQNKLEELRERMIKLNSDVKELQATHSEKKTEWSLRIEELNKYNEFQRSNLKSLSEDGEWLTYNVLYDFEARTHDELNLRSGDVVQVKVGDKRAELGWLYGKLGEETGCFPESYVAMVINNIGPDKFDEETEEVTIKEEGAELGLYIALYQYASEEACDLSFEAHDVITVTQANGDWWTGRIADRTGIFPSNFVKKYDHPMAPAAPDQLQIVPKLIVMKKPEIATVIAMYEATGPEQLSLSPGQLMQVRKKSETGWWEGELQVRGQKRQIGWFPSNYVKLLNSGVRHSADSFGGEPKVTSSELPKLPAPEQMVALYDFVSDREDELSLKTGDVVTVFSKQMVNWLHGECQGKVGIFPANFVGALPPQ